MRIVFLFLGWFVNIYFCLAQSVIPSDSVRLNFSGQISDFGTDDFNQLYYIRNSVELNKFDYKTKELKSFSNRNILEDLNTQNILQLTLKSGFFNLLILDRMLNPVQDPIDLSANPDFIAALAAVVDNNYLWIFDPAREKLILWNYRENKIIRESVILNDEDASAYYSGLFYTGNKIYLSGPDKILMFDEFANLEKVIPVEAHDKIRLYGKQIFYSKGQKIYELDTKTAIAESIEIGFDFDDFSINKDFLFVLKDKVVYIYNTQNLF